MGLEDGELKAIRTGLGDSVARHCINIDTYTTEWDIRVNLTSYYTEDSTSDGFWVYLGTDTNDDRIGYSHRKLGGWESPRHSVRTDTFSGSVTVEIDGRPTKLRIKRSGNVLYFYYMYDSVWTLVSSEDYTGMLEFLGPGIVLRAYARNGIGGYCTFDYLVDKQILPATTTTITTASTVSTTLSTVCTTITTTSITTITTTTITATFTTTTTALPPAQDEPFNDLDDWTIQKQDGTEHVEIISNELHLEVEQAKDSLIEMYHRMAFPSGNHSYTIDIVDYYALLTIAGGKIALVGVSNDFQDQVYIEFRQDSNHSPQWRGLTKHRINGSWTSPADTFSTATMPSKLKVRRAGTDMELSYYDGSWNVVTTVDFSTRVNNITRAGISFDDNGFQLSWVDLDNLDYT